MSRFLPTAARIFLGIIFLGAGINGYFVIFGLDPFIATSPEAMALFEFQYLLVFEKTLEVICGILLLINRFVPLSLAVLSPIIANIFLLHLFLDRSLLLLAIVLVLTLGYLLYQYRWNFLGILERKVSLDGPGKTKK
ncbi:DoxX family membrane protein [Evansella tamaricis]|uniref:DoxX family membrane protein n=1 Tax=Evansella tamaricis TaxID=2069301 RepID=A0ABS6JN22_9BACI|nr:DoxX family membrane protein [Evansella tamaricis]MBU9714594.1 DoxX family membrane protein [Evansella tamaricis]